MFFIGTIERSEIGARKKFTWENIWSNQKLTVYAYSAGEA